MCVVLYASAYYDFVKSYKSAKSLLTDADSITHMFTNLFAPHLDKMCTEQFRYLAVKLFGCCTMAPGSGFFNIENWRNYQGRSDYTINYSARSMLSCLGGREE